MRKLMPECCRAIIRPKFISVIARIERVGGLGGAFGIFFNLTKCAAKNIDQVTAVAMNEPIGPST